MAQMQQQEKPVRPPQIQTRQPGLESVMEPAPQAEPRHRAREPKLKDRVALITGGDSGIGRAVALAFAEEGADVCIVYLNEDEDALETANLVKKHGHRCLTHAADVGDEMACQRAVEAVVREFGRIDILVNNAAEQHPQETFEYISTEQIERTFRTNVFSMFHTS
jgi:NAD(P)-dependent dehydrogenase (short-subunit alcohol dehydrogenase family)